MQEPSKEYRILSADVLVADEILPLEQGVVPDGELKALVEKYGFQPTKKYPLNDVQFKEFAALAERRPGHKIMPGGSSANVLTTLAKLLGNVKVDFLGVAGGKHEQLIKDALTEGGHVTLWPERLPAEPKPQAATSFAIMFPATKEYPKGQRALVTHPGNIKHIIRKEMVTDDMVQKCDAVLVQGSLWQKLHETSVRPNGHADDHDLGFADTLLKKRWKAGKELWLAMPTQAKFGEESAGLFQWLIRSGNVVLGNDEELARVYTTREERQEIADIIDRAGLYPKQIEALGKLPENATAEELAPFNVSLENFKKYDFGNNSVRAETAISRLQATLDQEFLKQKAAEGEWKGSTKQVAFITRGPGKDAVIVTPKKSLQYAAPAEDPPGGVINTLGAGDSSFAGFLAGHVRRLPDIVSAKIAMAVAGLKLRYDSARIPEPLPALQEAHPDLAQELNGLWASPALKRSVGVAPSL